MKANGISFEQWVSEWSDEIQQMQALTKSDLPTQASEIQAAMNRATRDYPRAAELLADAEGHIIRCRAQETMLVRTDPKFAGFTADERRAIVESRIVDILHIRNILKAICRALQERHFSLMSQRAYEREALRMSCQGE